MSFDVAFLKEGRYVYHKLSNDHAGFKALVKVLPADSQVAMETFRPYYLQLAYFVYECRYGCKCYPPF